MYKLYTSERSQVSLGEALPPAAVGAVQRVQKAEESKIAAHPVRPSAALVMPVMKLGLRHGDEGVGGGEDGVDPRPSRQTNSAGLSMYNSLSVCNV